jgi:hypothetical protein
MFDCFKRLFDLMLHVPATGVCEIGLGQSPASIRLIMIENLDPEITCVARRLKGIFGLGDATPAVRFRAKKLRSLVCRCVSTSVRRTFGELAIFPLAGMFFRRLLCRRLY